MFVITRDAIDPRALEAQVATRADGGVVTFLGVVRERSDDGALVTGLGYEAYDTMAIAEFETIAAEARERFGDVRVGVIHRVGDLQIGDIAVAVCAASPHRAQAFDACEYVIDAVKERAAIWKKEHYAQREAQWRSN